jgi:transcriptional regulator with XRE-family HTH domain
MSRTPTDCTGPGRPQRRPQHGPAIRSLREKDGYSQTAFAKIIQISQPSLANIENEKKSVSIATLNRIARALRVPTAAIMREVIADEDAA